MADVFDTSDTGALPLSRINEAATLPYRFVLMHGGMKSAVCPQLWSATAPIDAVHSASRSVANVDVLFTGSAMIGGRGAAVMRDGAYLWDRNIYPSYIRQYYSANTGPDRWAFKPDLTPIKAKSVFAAMHFNYGYGHWLTEIFPKLFVIRMLNALGITAPLAWPKTVHAHLRKRTEEFLPDQEFLDYDPSTHFIETETVILPGAGSQDHFFHPILRDWFRSYPRPTGKKTGILFVSRGEIKHGYAYRNLTNAAELEQIAASLGAEIYHPEADPPDVQASRYASASMIVGEYGSGLHNTIFSPLGTRVLALNWVNGVQSRIGNLMSQRVGYVLAPDNVPRLFSNDGSVAEYSVDAGLFRSRLVEAMEVS